jgi:hypothetical protein
MTPKMVPMTRSEPRTWRMLRYPMVGMAAYCTLLIIRKLRPSMMKRSIWCQGRSAIIVCVYRSVWLNQ